MIAPDPPPDPPPDRRLLTFAVGAALLAMGWVGLAGFSSRSFTRAACREGRTTRDWHGWAWADERAGNECSRWYAAHVEPAHAHAWVALPHCRRFGIPGIYGGVACSMGGGPIVNLPRSTQLQVYSLGSSEGTGPQRGTSGGPSPVDAPVG